LALWSIGSAPFGLFALQQLQQHKFRNFSVTTIITIVTTATGTPSTSTPPLTPKISIQPLCIIILGIVVNWISAIRDFCIATAPTAQISEFFGHHHHQRRCSSLFQTTFDAAIFGLNCFSLLLFP
jgi:hypothetical protein